MKNFIYCLRAISCVVLFLSCSEDNGNDCSEDKWNYTFTNDSDCKAGVVYVVRTYDLETGDLNGQSPERQLDEGETDEWYVYGSRLPARVVASVRDGAVATGDFCFDGHLYSELTVNSACDSDGFFTVQGSTSN